jgi:hypothetical protein
LSEKKPSTMQLPETKSPFTRVTRSASKKKMDEEQKSNTKRRKKETEILSTKDLSNANIYGALFNSILRLDPESLVEFKSELPVPKGHTPETRALQPPRKRVIFESIEVK